MTTKRKKPPELKVVFDSNAIYTGSASDLLSSEATQLIKEHSAYSDLKVTWYLPDIVVHERQYQMIKKGLELLPVIQRLEKLLGHNLNITEDIIEKRVREVVESQIKQFNIQVLPLAIDRVDWNKIIIDAAYRHPPFEAGEKGKEKGFRDALIAETFMQILYASPSTPTVCRIVLVTADALLGGAVRTRVNSCTNFRLASTQEELKSLINTLVADVGEKYVAGIQEQAAKYFFIPNDKSTLYYREEITDYIRQNYASELNSLPKGSERRKNGTWYISPPRFVKKQGQKVSWISRISIEAQAFGPINYLGKIGQDQLTLQLGQPEVYSGLLPGSIIDPSNSYIIPNVFPSSISPLGGLSKSYLNPSVVTSPTFLETENPVASGETIFETTWSVSVSITQKFRHPRVEKIAFIETVWE